VFLGLGDRVSAHGFLGPDARERLAAALETYADKARALGAREVTVVGTEPLRRAADAAAALRDVERRTGLSVRVLDHHEEGTLTLLGVSMGRPVSAELLVLDIGGGSSEIVVAAPGRPVVTVGLRIGSARLTQDHVANDPPLLAEVDAMRDEARLVVAGAPPASPAELVVVGGTATNLVRLAPQALEDRLLGRDRIATALALLTEERSEVTAERHAVRPERARTLAAGAVILDAILERYHARRIRVSDAGVREGTIVAVALGHIGWRDSLETLATG
jgi:exopolyphosphatase/guanosine-5'-triphosphate,3'-diphosphate pyrophosphatase